MKYAFHCQSCNLIFTRSLPIGNYLNVPCPCGKEASRKLDESFSFNFRESKPGNTGVHKEDYPTADHAVGRDADARWEHIHERQKVKAKVRAVNKTSALVRTTTSKYLEYAPMPGSHVAARKRLVDDAVTALGSKQ